MLAGKLYYRVSIMDYYNILIVYTSYLKFNKSDTTRSNLDLDYHNYQKKKKNISAE